MALINQIYPQINKAVRQAWGKTPVEIIDNQTLISVGTDVVGNSTAAERDIFTNSLSSTITDTIFVSNDLRTIDLKISRDERGWNGIKRKVRMKPILTIKNTEYDLDNTEAYNPWEIVVPVVDEKVYAKFGTYAVKVTIPDQQVFTAFESIEKMEAFYSMIYKVCEDAIIRGEIAYDRLALANFIGEKFNLQTTQTNKIHTLNVLQLFNTTFNQNLTVDSMWYNSDFLRFLVSVIDRYKRLMNDDTDAFNSSDGYPSQCPDSRLNLYMLSNITSALPAYLYSDTFNYNLNKLNNFIEVNYWQGIGDTNTFQPVNTSAIHLNIASNGNEINETGIIGLLVDKDAVATYYNRHMAESWRIPTKGNQYYKSITREMINDTMENGLVLYAKNPA